MRQIGFSGTRIGMTRKQADTLACLLASRHAGVLHHGDCIGADAQAHDLALEFGLQVLIHPPTRRVLRAFCEGPTLPPLGYLARNRAIVDATAELIACPEDENEASRSGTWSTIRYARRVGRDVTIIPPTGGVVLG